MSVNINRNHHGVWSWKLSGTGTGMTFVDCAISVYSVYSFIATCDMCLHNPCCTLLAWSKSHVACPKPVLETFLQCPQEPGPILNERAAWKAVKNTWWLRPFWKDISSKQNPIIPFHWKKSLHVQHTSSNNDSSTSCVYTLQNREPLFEPIGFDHPHLSW